MMDEGAPGPEFRTWDVLNFPSDRPVRNRTDPVYPFCHDRGAQTPPAIWRDAFLTFSCWHRLPYLCTPQARDLFESALERIRKKYEFAVIGYVVMAEHVHLLLNEPKRSSLDQVIKAIKLSVTLRREERPFWQARYYDFNVFTDKKRVEKLRYMHRNPVVRGLVEKPEDWQWSSFRHYAGGVEGTLKIESFWTARRREHGEIPSQVRKSGPGAPSSIAAVKSEHFFAERRKRADREAFRRILNREGGEPPWPEDTID